MPDGDRPPSPDEAADADAVDVASDGGAVEETNWIGILEVQCSKTPWSMGGPEGGRMDSVFETGTDMRAVDDYLYAGGVDAMEVGIGWVNGPVFACCGCSSGRSFVARIPVAALTVAVDLGFTPDVAKDDSLRAVTQMPLSCDKNPWMAEAKAQDEIRNVFAYFEGAAGVTIIGGGFAWPTRLPEPCLECACPRGDRLILVAGVKDAELLIADYSFEELQTS